MSQMLDLQARTTYNQSVSLLQLPWAFHAYEQMHANFSRLIAVPADNRDLKGHSHASLGTFLLLMQRQGSAAFWSLASFQSYEAWVLLRPLLEAVLIVGKWIDDPRNAEIWKARDADRRAYIKAHTGEALESTSLPRSSALRSVLSRINDNFMHLNPDYFFRHVETPQDGPAHVRIQVHYFDRDPVEHELQMLAFLHLVLVVQDSLAGLGHAVFGIAVDVGLNNFESAFQERATARIAERSEGKTLLRELGLWSAQQEADTE